MVKSIGLAIKVTLFVLASFLFLMPGIFLMRQDYIIRVLSVAEGYIDEAIVLGIATQEEADQLKRDLMG